MKTTEKYGACNRKHSINVLKKNITEYFEMYTEDKNDIPDLVAEAMQELKTDSLMACEWAWCTK